MRRYLLYVFLLPAVGCSDATATENLFLSVETTEQMYVAGDTIDVLATNIGDVALHYGFCNAQIERHEGGSRWVGRSVLPTGAACISLPLRLEPGDSITSHLVLPHDAAVGVFRFIVPFFVIERANEYQQRTRASNLFFVRGTR